MRFSDREGALTLADSIATQLLLPLQSCYLLLVLLWVVLFLQESDKTMRIYTLGKASSVSYGTNGTAVRWQQSSIDAAILSLQFVATELRWRSRESWLAGSPAPQTHANHENQA